MRKLNLLVAMIICLFLFGCSERTVEKQSEQTNKTVLTEYESVVPDDVKELDIYKKALSQNSIITYNNTPITDVQNVKDFLEDIKNDKHAEINCYRFCKETDDEGIENHRIVYYKLYNEDDYIVLQSFYSDEYNVEEWTDLQKDGHIEKYKNVGLSDYGMLYCYDDDILNSGFSVKVLNYDQVPSFKISEEKAKELEEKYFKPLLPYLVYKNNFDSINDIQDWCNIFDVLYYYKNKISMYDVYHDKISMNDFMSLINEYFDVDKQTVIGKFVTYETAEKHTDEYGNLQVWDTYYDEATDSIILGDAGIFGAGADLHWVITDCKEEGSNLTLYYSICNVVNYDPISKCELKVKLLDDGSFRYISCIEVK